MDKMECINKLRHMIKMSGTTIDNNPAIDMPEIMYHLGLKMDDGAVKVFHLAPDQGGFIGTLVSGGVIERNTDGDYVAYRVTDSYRTYFIGGI